MDEQARGLLDALKNLVRQGTTSSVDEASRTARVIFDDMESMVSGPLKVLVNHPLITVENTVDGQKWTYAAQYASVDRKLGLGESYTTAPPDVITTDISLDYKCITDGVDETKFHQSVVTVRPWLPYIGQKVLCLYLPKGESDGFVLGGIE